LSDKDADADATNVRKQSRHGIRPHLSPHGQQRRPHDPSKPLPINAGRNSIRDRPLRRRQHLLDFSEMICVRLAPTAAGRHLARPPGPRRRPALDRRVMNVAQARGPRVDRARLARLGRG
jgi:hypothetical protein